MTTITKKKKKKKRKKEKKKKKRKKKKKKKKKMVVTEKLIKMELDEHTARPVWWKRGLLISLNLKEIKYSFEG